MVSNQNFWLFQYKAKVKVERFVENSQPGEVIDWQLTRYKNRVDVGDVVFFWRAGEMVLRGWGVVAGSLKTPKGSETDRIPVETKVMFEPSIPKAELLSVTEISDLAVITQGRRGTNFAVSTLQAAGLARLISEKGFEAPGVETGEIQDALRRRADRELGNLESVVYSLPEGDAREAVLQKMSNLREHLPKVTTRDQAAAVSLDAVEIQRTFDQQILPSVKSSVAGDAHRTANNLVGILSKMAGQEPPTPEQTGDETIEPAEQDTSRLKFADLDDPLVWHWEEKDQIGIGEPVHNLARYIAHQDLLPPKAIGIFGDWGSGKTFFMNALKSQIALLAHQSRQAKSDNDPTVFCSNVVQIDFNAWHYVESNLWASLAGHIFENLYTSLRERTDHEEALDELFKSLDTYHEAAQAQEDAEEIVKRLDKECDQIAKVLQGSELTFKETVQAAEKVAREYFQTQFLSEPTESEEAQSKDREPLSSGEKKLSESEKRKLQALLDRSNLDELVTSYDELSDVVQSGKSLAGQLTLEMRSWKWGSFVTAIAAAIAVTVLVPMGVTKAFQLDLFSDTGVIAEFCSIVGLYATSAVGVLGWIAVKGRGLLSSLIKVHGFTQQAREHAQREKATELESNQRDVREARAELENAERRLLEAKESLESIKLTMERREVGTQLKEFIEARVRDKTYEEHLGLVSLVRKDFERLSALTEAYWTQKQSGESETFVDFLPEGTQEVKKVPFTERIALYIDDLDRCPTSKVVDVLQAVHLLLGFKLFVVVVGVDVRWVGQSLIEQYPTLLSRGNDDSATDDGWNRATSDDYLEKIFQIPFRIPPLNDEAREHFVGGLIEERFLEGWSSSEEEQAFVPVFDLNPPELDLYDDEKQCLAELHNCVGRSPRRVKRFVDAYRLMRAGMDEGNVEVVLSAQRYREILSLFALLTGSPRLGPRLLELLYAALIENRSVLVGGDLSEWFTNCGQDLDRYSADEVASARSVFEYLGMIEDREKMLDGLLEWIPEVARYSFRHVHLVSS